MYGDPPRRVVAVRLSESELEQLDALVADEKRGKRQWWEPASRSSVIREAIANRYTALEGRKKKPSSDS